MAHKLDSEKKLWEKAAAFHGHVCPGLTIGYRAALYAMDLLELTFSDDEQVVCIAENDACGVDAIQAILGCSIGKGNLLFHMRGKQAFSFYNRKTGKSVRLVLKARPRDMTREETFDYYHIHGQALSLGENDVVLKGRIDIGGNVGGGSPSGTAVLHILAEFLGVLAFDVDRQPERGGDQEADQQIGRVEARK